jgi:HTH-type transcriptional regulator / antitoxin HigA
MKSRTVVRTIKDQSVLFAPRNEDEYDAAVARMSKLMDEVGDKPEDPRYRLIETLGVLIANYDAKHHAIPQATPVEVLQFLMEQHQLKQSDLPEIGTQGVVSEILSGRRHLNVRQIQALAARFGVDAGVFVPRSAA